MCSRRALVLVLSVSFVMFHILSISFSGLAVCVCSGSANEGANQSVPNTTDSPVGLCFKHIWSARPSHLVFDVSSHYDRQCAIDIIKMNMSHWCVVFCCQNVFLPMLRVFVQFICRCVPARERVTMSSPSVAALSSQSVLTCTASNKPNNDTSQYSHTLIRFAHTQFN